MIDVSDKIEAVKKHQPSGITWVKLRDDSDFEWMLTQHPATPDGFVSIGGANNGSYRFVSKVAFDLAASPAEEFKP